MEPAVDGFALGGPDLHICLGGDICMVTQRPDPHVEFSSSCGCIWGSPLPTRGCSACFVLGTNPWGCSQKNNTKNQRAAPVTPSCACGDASPLLYQLFHRAGAVLRAQPRGAQRLAAHPHGKQDPGKESCMGGRRQKAGCRERGGQLTLSSSWSWFSTTTAVQV